MVSFCGEPGLRATRLMPGAQRSPDDDADDDADDAVEEISTDDGRDLGDVSEVAGQLAGATSQIAEQLSMITEAAQLVKVQSGHVPQLGSCASSTCRLWAARHSQEAAGPLGTQLSLITEALHYVGNNKTDVPWRVGRGSPRLWAAWGVLWRWKQPPSSSA